MRHIVSPASCRVSTAFGGALTCDARAVVDGTEVYHDDSQPRLVPDGHGDTRTLAPDDTARFEKMLISYAEAKPNLTGNQEFGGSCIKGRGH